MTGVQTCALPISSYNVFSGLNSIHDAILATEVPNLSIVSANTNLAAIELDLIHLKNYENILVEKLEEIKNAFLRHQPHDEIQRCLVILNAIFTYGVAGFQAVLEFDSE